MPRKPRLCIAGLPHHIVVRGNDRMPIIRCDADARMFLSELHQTSIRFGVAVHAFVLMTNHLHAIATPGDSSSLSRLLQSHGRRYVRYFNDTYSRTGTLWEGRFSSSLVETDRYLWACHRYIELNPVRAGMVAHPADYRWSSYRANALGERNPLVIPHPCYTALAADQRVQRERYREIFDEGLACEELERIRDAIRLRLPIATDEYVASLEGRSGQRIRHRRSGRPRKEPEIGV